MVQSSLNISPRAEAVIPASAHVGRGQNELASGQGNRSLTVYEPTPSSVSPGLESDESGDVDGAAVHMSDEGRVDMPDSSSPKDRTRSNRRRSPQPHATPRHRLPSGHPLHPPSSGYAVSSSIHSENNHNVAPSSHFSPSYNQRPVYGPHLMPTHPSGRMDHTQNPPYAYHQQYHPGVPDNSIMHQNMHASYQHMMQPPSAVYPYQHHSSGSGSPLPSVGPPVYPHHQVNLSPSPHNHFPPSSAGQNGVQSPSYHGTSQFQALRYPSPISPRYAYQHSYSNNPVYPSPYAPSPYGQHYPSPVEPDRQSGWWYFPPVPSPHQYEGGPYPGHYSLPYTPGAGRQENSPSAPSPSSPTAPGFYAMSPTCPPPPLALVQPAASPSPLIVGTGSSGADINGVSDNNRPSTSEKPLVRRSYHPNPPSHRSEWVMWVGNVPSDATYDELWRFFNQPLDPSSEDSVQSGVLSIFLIARSCCAFVNFDSESRLQQSIKRFHGKTLRSDDPRCPRLVCRVRRKDDDLKAGVGAQRGMGVHTRWVKDQKAKAENSAHNIPTPSSPRSNFELTTLLLSGNEEGFKQRTAKYSSSSGSYASTNSSILARHFPQRYFILKSLTQYDLDLSVEKGLWATQKHNEGILDQAYRTSQEVFLIFSVNKSGEFYGYARMAGPVRHGEHRVSWATRTTDSSASSRSSLSPVSGRGVVASPLNPDLSASPARLSQPKGQGSAFFSPDSTRIVQESPLPLSSSESRKLDAEYPHAPPNALVHEQVQSAPGDVGPPRSKVSPQVMKYSLDQQLLRRPSSSPPPLGSTSSNDFELDPTAPIRAMRSSGSSRGSDIQGGSGGSKRSLLLQAVVEEEEKGDDEEPGGEKLGEEEEREETWGESFKIEWLCTEKLSFHRTRHLRNLWNHDREVKVSRDGTELEPTVGRRLVEEWTRLSEVQPTGTPGRIPGFLRRVAKPSPSAGTETPKMDRAEIGNTDGRGS